MRDVSSVKAEIKYLLECVLIAKTDSTNLAFRMSRRCHVMLIRGGSSLETQIASTAPQVVMNLANVLGGPKCQ